MHALLSVVALLAAPQSTEAQDPAVTLRFKYAAGDREVVDARIGLVADASVRTGLLDLTGAAKGPISYSLDVRCGEVKDGNFILEASFGGYEAEQEAKLGPRELKVTAKDADVRVEDAAGKVLFDGAAGDREKAVERYREVTRTTELTLTPRGLIAAAPANRLLRVLLGGFGADTLFPVVLLEEPVRVGGSWEHALKADGIPIEGDAPEMSVTYRLEKVEGDVAVISIKGETTLKDLSIRTVTVREAKIALEGTARFRVGAGRIEGTDLKLTVEGSGEADAGSGDLRLEMDVETKVRRD